MKYYDLFISVGGACRPAYHLQINGLRNEAYPLDWQKEYSLDTVIHLFKTKFVDFFVDIEEECSVVESEYRQIKDVKNSIISIHHFPKNIQLEKAQEEFLGKMKKRFENLDDKLQKSHRIVLICNRADTIKNLKAFLMSFSAIYPHLEIKLINVRNCENGSVNSYNVEYYMLSDNLSIEEYSFNDNFNCITKKKADWRGNMGVWRDILKNYYSKYRVLEFERMQEIKSENQPFVIYGAGKRCIDLLYIFEMYDIKVKGIAVADPSINPQSIGDYRVDDIKKYDKNDKIVISLKDSCEVEKIKNMLLSQGYLNLFVLNNTLNIKKVF